MYREVDACRICDEGALVPILHLGNQCLTGVFPASKEEVIPAGPLELVKCEEAVGGCGLAQLRHSYSQTAMYGDNYGYRSGLNASMVNHLRRKVEAIAARVSLRPGDVVVDIGSNDGTLLRHYPSDASLDLVGIDPTGTKMSKYYPDYIRLIPEFFPSKTFQNDYGAKKARVVTSIAMFYDLESPGDFVRQVHDILADDGIWVFEQSYLPSMLATNSYDMVCHEHLEYYRLKQIKWLTDRAQLKIVDIEFNETNGGSFCVTAAKAQAPYPECASRIEQILQQEETEGLASLKPYQAFQQRVFEHRDRLCEFLDAAQRKNEKILGYGASTKGNVLLQFCGFGEAQIACIAEVNEDKFGCYTPGTKIPIVPEDHARNLSPDYFLVLPWHFREHIVARESEYLASNGKLLFPLPRVEVVSQAGLSRPVSGEPGIRIS